MRGTCHLILSLLVILCVSLIPQAWSFCIPPNPASDDGKWELYGPHITGIRIHMYSCTAAMFNAMDVGEIDIESWALDTAHATSWSTPAGPITIQNYGGEAGYFLWDVNCNATYAVPFGVSSTMIHNPTSELPLRRALSTMVNRSYMVDYSGGLANPIYTPVPSYMGGYIYGSPPEWYTLSGNLTLANSILDANGYTVDGSGWRIDPVSQGGNGQPLNLVVYGRSGDRNALALDMVAMMTACHIKTTTYLNLARSQVIGPVFANESFNLYTGAWTGIGPDPDYLCDLYNGSNYWHPGSPPNYDNVNFPETNANATRIKLAPDLATGLVATLDFQKWYMYYTAGYAVWSYSGVKAYKNVPHETSTSMNPVTSPDGCWKHLVNQKGVGVNSWWSTLDIQNYGNIYPNLNVWYGFDGTITLQNIVYVQWYWDQEVVHRIYDGGWARDPYTLLWAAPQLYKAYKFGSWIDPVTRENKTSVTVTLRPDVYWQDGQPVTIADVYYTLVEISKDLLAKGFPPPFWYPTVQYMRSVEIIDDYNMQILLDVQSVWAAGWVICSVVIPEHIWKPIVDASTNDGVHDYIQGVTPDANIIGSGPFKWFSGVGGTVGDDIVMVANTPGAQDTYHNTTSPGYYLLNPVWVDADLPNNLVKVNVNPTDTSALVPVNMTLRNLWTDGNLTVNMYAYVNDTLQAGYPINQTLAPISPYPAGASDVETVNLTLPVPSLTYVKVAVQIIGDGTLTYTEPWDNTTATYTVANPWLNQWINVTLPIWVTIKQDIGKSDLFTVMGYSLTGIPAATQNAMKASTIAPDLVVEGRDIAIASKAFGTVPGAPAWSSVADITGSTGWLIPDYKVDIKDIAAIAKQYGWGWVF